MSIIIIIIVVVVLDHVALILRCIPLQHLTGNI